MRQFLPTMAQKDLQKFATTLLASVFFLAGCANNPASLDGVYDPAEPLNRSIHGFNKAADTVVLRPISRVYGAAVPEPIDQLVENGASNLSLPADVINHTLQGDIEATLAMTGRFVLNSTIGILGFFDPASELGLADDSTDFGETLHVWGVGEGAYVELPLLGPSTARDAVGRGVDLLTNPLGAVLPASELEATVALRTLDIVASRHRLKAVLDPVLYGSADSYTAARIGYLLNRRSNLQGGTLDEEDLDDPFAFDP